MRDHPDSDSPRRLIDPFNRHLSYLRVSVTDRCNLRCMYCRPNFMAKLPHRQILSYEELIRILHVATGLGITKIRVTGGEPLVRKGLCDFLKTVTQMEGLRDVSLTTNGVLLKNHIQAIREAGIRRINISLDTLKREKFKQITGFDMFPQVWEGIDLARKAGFSPVKLNVVALRGINDDELIDFARLSLKYPFHVRFIEYMPIGSANTDPGRQLLADEIRDRLQVLGRLIPVERAADDGPAERFRFESASGEIGLIRPISHHFCARCNRLRLTASGRLRSCLLSDTHVDIKTPLRNGCSDADLADIFLQAVAHKPSEHCLSTDRSARIAGQMSAIGG